MYVGLKQPRGDGERYVTPARAAAKETIGKVTFMTLTLNRQTRRMNSERKIKHYQS